MRVIVHRAGEQDGFYGRLGFIGHVVPGFYVIPEVNQLKDIGPGQGRETELFPAPALAGFPDLGKYCF